MTEMENNIQKNKLNKVWLNVASSTYVLPDFINLDNHIFIKFKTIFQILKPFLSTGHVQLAKAYTDAASRAILLRHDCRKKLKYGDNTVDHILCSHFLEHVYLEETKTILADFYRVLKPGGTLHIIVPDLNKFIYDYLEMGKNGNQYAADEFIKNSILSKTTRGSLRYRLMEFQGGFGLQHRWMYDRPSMVAHITDIGFEIDDYLNVPSDEYRKNDDSVHVKAKK